MKLILTCEHATNALPQEFRYLNNVQDPVWATHRAYDPGAFKLFENLTEIADYHFAFKFSRLLIEPNRSLHHRNLFSEYSKELTAAQKTQLIEDYYLKYRNEVEKCITKIIEAEEQVIHLSIHSFTPIFKDLQRNTDLGILYDPSFETEKKFAANFKNQLANKTTLKVRRNYPYLGKADGFTTYLRKKFRGHYVGIELEVNQKLAKNNKFPKALMEQLKISLQETLINFDKT